MNGAQGVEVEVIPRASCFFAECNPKENCSDVLHRPATTRGSFITLWLSDQSIDKTGGAVYLKLRSSIKKLSPSARRDKQKGGTLSRGVLNAAAAAARRCRKTADVSRHIKPGFYHRKIERTFMRRRRTRVLLLSRSLPQEWVQSLTTFVHPNVIRGIELDWMPGALRVYRGGIRFLFLNFVIGSDRTLFSEFFSRKRINF